MGLYVLAFQPPCQSAPAQDKAHRPTILDHGSPMTPLQMVESHPRLTTTAAVTRTSGLGAPKIQAQFTGIGKT